MAYSHDDESFRFIGTELENLIARIERERERSSVDAQKALDGAIKELRQATETLQRKFFLPTWFILR